MKTCERCGAKNSTGSRYCRQCGASFSTIDVSASAPDSDASADFSERRERRVQKYEARPNEKIGEATSEFFGVVGSSLLAIFTALGRWLWRLVRPVGAAAFGYAREHFKRAFLSSGAWDRDWIPNFLYWGLLGAFLWRLPTSLIGIVYAILANDARRQQDFTTARSRAESAKNWLIVDFVVGLILFVFKKLVL